jgi:hypothetical protein
MTDNFGQTFIIHYKNDENDGPTYEEDNQQDQPSHSGPQNRPNDAPRETDPPASHDSIKDEVHKDMINSFLNGDQCLNGVGLFLNHFYLIFVF